MFKNRMQVLQNIKSHNQIYFLQILTTFKYCNKKNLIKKSCTFHQMMEGVDIIKCKRLVQFLLCTYNLIYVNFKTI